MSEREIPPVELNQTEISDYMLGRDSNVVSTVEISDDTTGEVYGYKVWYENYEGPATNACADARQVDLETASRIGTPRIQGDYRSPALCATGLS